MVKGIRFTLVAALLGSAAAAHAGFLVVNNDEWTLSGTGFANSPSAGTFIRNVTNLFTGDQGGKFLAYSNNFGLTGSELKAAVEGGHTGNTWTVSTAQPFTLAYLQQFQGVFLGGMAVDQQVVIDYLQGGGNVYIMAGAGLPTGGGSAAEAAAWNTILDKTGLAYETTYNGIGGNVAPVGPHALLAGVSSLFFSNGNSVKDLNPADSTGEILYSLNGQGMLALGRYGALPPSSIYSPIQQVPEPATLALAGLGGWLATRRRRTAGLA